jgi:hypothetical protein
MLNNNLSIQLDPTTPHAQQYTTHIPHTLSYKHTYTYTHTQTIKHTTHTHRQSHTHSLTVPVIASQKHRISGVKTDCTMRASRRVWDKMDLRERGGRGREREREGGGIGNEG